MNQLTSVLDTYLAKKAPALPAKVKDVIVRFAPWVIIIVIIFSIPAILGFLGLGAMFAAPVMGTYMMAGFGSRYFIALIFLTVSLILALLSLPGLMKQRKDGWNMIYYSILVDAVYSLLNLYLLSLIIGSLISLYLLFQVRSYYK
ncbi:MAG: hypothetical protein M1607_00770 [Patescibacteria group bacterium]|nr:hypothetical protein [Patescibacteria group bacterium]